MSSRFATVRQIVEAMIKIVVVEVILALLVVACGKGSSSNSSR